MNELILLGLVLAVLGLFTLGPANARTPSQRPGDAMLVLDLELALSDDLSVALEDSVEMLCLDLQDPSVRNDQALIGPKVLREAVRHARPSVSPPLLV